MNKLCSRNTGLATAAGRRARPRGFLSLRRSLRPASPLSISSSPSVSRYHCSLAISMSARFPFSKPTALTQRRVSSSLALLRLSSPSSQFFPFHTARIRILVLSIVVSRSLSLARSALVSDSVGVSSSSLRARRAVFIARSRVTLAASRARTEFSPVDLSSPPVPATEQISNK